LGYYGGSELLQSDWFIINFDVSPMVSFSWLQNPIQ
jgi:hypothetical protein